MAIITAGLELIALTNVIQYAVMVNKCIDYLNILSALNIRIQEEFISKEEKSLLLIGLEENKKIFSNSVHSVDKNYLYVQS